MELFDIYIIAEVVILSAALWFVAGYAEKVVTQRWRILYFLPFLLCIFLTAGIGFEISMLGAYIAAALPLAGFVRDSKKVRRICCIAACGLSLTALPVCLLNGNYRAFDYTKDFETGFTAMRNRYVLSEYKDVEWDSLYREYRPKFAAAEDDIDAYIAWSEFCAEFHDGHVGYVPETKTEEEEDAFKESVFMRLGANDYGLCLLTDSEGRAAAVNVDESLSSLGIKNGTIITAWDGKDVFEAAKESPLFRILSFPDKDNELFYLPACAAGFGGESVTVSFLDDSGKERSAQLPLLGGYYKRFKSALETVKQGYPAANFGWEELSDSTVLLRIKLMSFDKSSSRTEDYSDMKSQLKSVCEEQLANGKTNLVIDLRGNGGGSGQLVKALGETFAPVGTHFYCCDGVWDSEEMRYLYDEESKTYPTSVENTFVGEDCWRGNQIVVLVNSDSVSAADHLNMILQGKDNITIMGFTESTGSAQGVGSMGLTRGILSFSGSLVLNRDGTPFVDAGTDRESGNDIDIRVPLDEAAITALYDRGEDYLLEKAMEYLSQQ